MTVKANFLFEPAFSIQSRPIRCFSTRQRPVLRNVNTSLGMLTALICLAIPALGFAEPLSTRYPVNGDLNKDGVTDLLDLCLLGTHWDDTLEVYALTRQSISSDISEFWRETVPATLAAQAQKSAFDTLLVANLDPATKSQPRAMREAEMKRLEKSGFDTKGIEGALAIGFAVDIPVAGRPEVNPREQIFNVLDDEGELLLLSNRTFAQVPRGGFVDESADLGLAANRYDAALFDANFPVETTEFKLETLDSAFKEANALGFDINVQARYASFTGSLDIGIDNEFYADQRNFKALLYIRQSFGWRFMPSDLIEENLTQDFRTRRDQALIDDQIDLTDEYGTYVAIADHRVRSLALIITVRTSKEESRSEVAAKIKAAFGGVGSSFSLDSALNTFRASLSTIEDVTIDSAVVGGPALLDLDNNPTTPSVSLESTAAQIAADAANGLSVNDRWSNLVDAWITVGNITNAASVDFVYSPVANFQRLDRNPLTKGASMRAWFKRYLECDEALARANLILAGVDRVPEEGDTPDPANLILRSEYSYLDAIAPFTPPLVPGEPFTYGTFDTYREYAANAYVNTTNLYFDLFEKGQLIASSTVEAPEIFRPQEPFFIVPDFQSPTYSLSLAFTGSDRSTDSGRPSCECSPAGIPAYCGQCLSAHYNLTVNGIDLRDQNRFRLIYKFNPNFTNTDGMAPCDAGADLPWGFTIDRGPSDIAYQMTRYAAGRMFNCGGCATSPGCCCWFWWDGSYASSGVGLEVGLFDVVSQNVVFGVYPGGGEMSKGIRASLKTGGVQLDPAL